MLTIKEYNNKDEKLKALVYWTSGVGKTAFAGTSQIKYKTLFISAEAWLSSIRKGQQNPWTNEDNPSNPHVLSIRTIEDIRALRKKGTLESIAKDYEVIVIDSFTEISDWIKRSFKDWKKNVTIQDWGIIWDELKDFALQCRDIDKHILMICHEGSKQDWESISQYYPMLDWSFKDKVAHYFDVVARIVKLPWGSRFLEISSNDRAIIKSRINDINENTETDFSKWIDIFVSTQDTQEETIIKEVTDNTYATAIANTEWLESNDLTQKLYQYLEDNEFSPVAESKIRSQIEWSPKIKDEERDLYNKFVTSCIEISSQS